MNKWAYIVAAPFALYGLAFGWRAMQWRWTFFRPSEFGPWVPFLNPELLNKLDALRFKWNRPIYVSPVRGGIGRAIHDDEEGYTSQHNLLLTGVVNAVDVFPAGDGGGPLTPAEAERFKALAQEYGFTGIGFYPDTSYRGRRWPMVHLDVRDSDLATWGRFGGGAVGRDYRYVSWTEAANKYRSEVT